MMIESVIDRYAIPYLTIKCGKKQDKVKIEKVYGVKTYKVNINKIKHGPFDFKELEIFLKTKDLYDDLVFKIEEKILIDI
jgi:hypothetical protein